MSKIYPDPSGPGPDQVRTLLVDDLLRFIHEQPGDKFLDMTSTTCRDGSCVLADYGVHIGLAPDVQCINDRGVYAVWCSGLETVAKFDSDVRELFVDDRLPLHVTNYARLRSYLKPEYSTP